MTEDQKRELYDAIDYDEEKAAIAAAVDMPKDVSRSLCSKLVYVLIINATTDHQIQNQYGAQARITYTYAVLSHRQTPGSCISRI